MIRADHVISLLLYPPPLRLFLAACYEYSAVVVVQCTLIILITTLRETYFLNCCFRNGKSCLHYSIAGQVVWRGDYQAASNVPATAKDVRPLPAQLSLISAHIACRIIVHSDMIKLSPAATVSILPCYKQPCGSIVSSILHVHHPLSIVIVVIIIINIIIIIILARCPAEGTLGKSPKNIRTKPPILLYTLLPMPAGLISGGRPYKQTKNNDNESECEDLFQIPDPAGFCRKE